MTYAEKLRDPRWQRKRLEILSRDDWTCRSCSSTTNMLNVHHRRYRRGAEPWEYEDFDLVTVCDGCHEDLTLAGRALEDLAAKLKAVTDASLIWMIIGYAETVIALSGRLEDPISVTPEKLVGMTGAFFASVSAAKILDKVNDGKIPPRALAEILHAAHPELGSV